MTRSTTRSAATTPVLDPAIIAALAGNPTAIAAYVASCSSPTPVAAPKGTAAAKSKTIASWTVRDSDRGKAPSGSMLWRAFDCGALTLPKGVVDAYTLGEAIAKALGIPVEVK